MVTTTDANGAPVRPSDLTEPQTARLMSLHHEWQGHPSRGLTPSKLAEILDAAERGDTVAQFELYEDMEEKDAHIASEMGKRRRAITELEWNIVPPPNASATEKRAARRMRELLDAIPDLEEALFDLTDAIGKGFAALEIEWHRLDGAWLPKTLTHRPQGWFIFHRGYREEIRLRGLSAAGDLLQPFGWLLHTHKAKSGWLARAALFRVLTWPYLFKNYSVADLAEFLEIYGIPLRVGKYPPGASEKEKLTLLRALTSLGHRAAGIIPEGMLIDFQPGTSGDPDAYQLMIDWCEKSQSKAILGGTLTSQADGKTSTNALGQVHDDVRKDLRDADVKQIAASLSQHLIYPIAALNGLAPGGPRRAPQWQFNAEEPEDLKTYADALPSLVSLGLRIPRQWAQERLGIPEPEDDAEVLGRQAAAGPPDAPEPSTPHASAAATAQAQPDHHEPDPAERQAIRASVELAPATDRWIEQIRDLVEHANSLEEVRDGLLELMPDMTLDEYTDAMQKALAAAQLAGRYEILQEAGQP